MGAGIELVGIAIALFGVSSPFGTGAGQTVQGNPVLAGLGVIITVVGLMLHVARV